MKKVVLGAMLLLTLPMISACGSDNASQSNSSQESSSEQVKNNSEDAIKEAESYIDKDKFYQAQDVLEEAKKNSDSETKEKIDDILSQIDLYQTAEDNYNDKRYDVARDNIDKVLKENNGSAVLKDKADKLKDKIEKEEDKKKEKKKEEDKKKEEVKERSKKGRVSNGNSPVGSKRSLGTWTSSKSSRLYSFMDSWATQMGQNYWEQSFDEPIVTLGDYSIDDLVDGTATPIVNGHEVTFSYGSSGDYEVVAAYDGATNDGTDTAYVFALGPGGPVALVAQGLANGRQGYVSFKPTANTTLQSGFANIANS